MLFNSFDFAVFFPLVTLVYFLIPPSANPIRLAWLLAASCWFYMAFMPLYILILFATILIVWATGLKIERASGAERKAWLWTALGANLGVLCFFKYTNFLGTNLAAAGRVFGWEIEPWILEFALPLGLSFHTFQAMSYSIEVYRGAQKAEHSLGVTALYVMFYPQLVAGPIERPQNLLHQFREKHAFDYARVTDGLKQMLWGLFKKCVVADRLALVVSRVYSDPQAFDGPQLLLATVFFSFQIYCDFSGYSDIAVGAARVMGFKLMKNFDAPFLSKSVMEFWRRWHISLSTWFRDYVYFPLGGSHHGKARLAANLMAVFILSGLWHGSAWTFVIWGLLNGVYCVVEALYLRKRAPGALVTFALITFSFIFFRAESLSDAGYVVTHLASGWGDALRAPGEAFSIAQTGLSGSQLVLAVLSVVFLLAFEAADRTEPWTARLARRPVWLRWPAYYALIAAIAILGVFNHAPFIYFQF